jgi:ATP-binding cassette subfamily B protein
VASENSGHFHEGQSNPSTEAVGTISFKWVFEFVRPHVLALSGVAALSIVATGIGLAQPYLTKFLIDDGLIARDSQMLATYCGLLFAAAIMSTALGGANRWYYLKVSARVLFAIREAVYEHMQRLSPRWYARKSRGDLMARIDGDVAEVQRFAIDPLLALSNGAIALAGSLALMISLSGELSLLAFVLLPLQVIYLRKLRPTVERRTRIVRERTGDITGFFLDRLQTMKLIQSSGAEDRELDKLGQLNQTFLKDLLSLQITNFFASAGPGLMTALMTTIVFLTGGMMVIYEAMSLGTLIAFSAYLARATGPVNTLLGLYVGLQRARVSLDRVRELMDAIPEVSSPATPISLPREANGTVELKTITFAFTASGAKVFDGATLNIQGGHKIGITGPSGVGKTTLIDLLLRHYDPDHGSLHLDGVNLTDLDLLELRSRVVVVAQDTVIVAGTIAENIAYACPEATDEQIVQAAKSAQIDNDIQAFTDGYQTMLQTGGETLSGGQKQRLAIARALLQNPLVLILDEATASVDEDTAAEITRSVDALFGDRTRIVISHHPVALAGADQIVELVDGGFVRAQIGQQGPQ